MSFATPLTDRAVLRLDGEEARPFLQGLVSNDVERVAPDRAIYTALLTPQGKFLFDFLVLEEDGALLLEVERERRDELSRKLALYRLRAKVGIAPDDRSVLAAWGDGVPAQFGLRPERGAALAKECIVAAVDPRLAALGIRIIAPRDAIERITADFEQVAPVDYDRHRLSLGVPVGGGDLIVGKSILLESNFEELAGVAFDKGCFVGQELTARTKHRGLIKKRLVPVAVTGELPEPGTPVTVNGREVGELRSGRTDRAIALLRLDALATAQTFEAGAARLTPILPDWLAHIAVA